MSRQWTFAVVLCFSLIAHVADARTFGWRGNHGYDGRTGQAGTDGQSAVLRASDQFQDLNLSGSSGGDGEDGRDGEDAYSCNPPHRPAHNLRGARGGDGGDGGSGGRGGNGGNLTVYYTDSAQLQNIRVVSAGGEGGRGGEREGRAGWGCRCYERSWTIRRCRRWEQVRDRNGNPTGRKRCTSWENRSYFCDDGYRGRRGLRGVDGNRGSNGVLTLIRSERALERERNNAQLKLNEWASEAVTLVDHVWRRSSGASQVLAAGSVIANDYREYVRTETKDFSLNWAAPQNVEDFADMNVQLSLKNGASEFKTPGLWYLGGVSDSPTATTLEINQAFKAKEIAQFRATNATGVLQDIAVTFVDDFAQDDPILTNVNLKVEYRGFGGNQILFEGEVADSLIVRDGGSYTVLVGQIPFTKEKHKKKGKTLRMTFTWTHSLDGTNKTKSKQQMVKYKVGKSWE